MHAHAHSSSSLLALLAAMSLTLSAARPHGCNATLSNAGAHSRNSFGGHHHTAWGGHRPNSTTTVSAEVTATASAISLSLSQVLVATTSEVTSTTISLGLSTVRSSETETETPSIPTSASTSTVESSTSSSTSASASASASTTTATASDSASAGSSASTTDADADAQTYLALHNDFRAEYGAGAVTWNDTLATYAQSTSDTCVFAHTGGPYGENLAAGVGNDYNITSGFDSWADEASEYDASNPQYSHFTQVVWKATTSIGCAISSCADGTIFTGYGASSTYMVCEYYPPGNVIGEFAANVGSYEG